MRSTNILPQYGDQNKMSKSIYFELIEIKLDVTITVCTYFFPCTNQVSGYIIVSAPGEYKGYLWRPLVSCFLSLFVHLADLYSCDAEAITPNDSCHHGITLHTSCH